MIIKDVIKFLMEKNDSFANFIKHSIVFKSKLFGIIHGKFGLSDREYLNLINVARKHEKAFAEYKGCFTGKSVAIIATGPSLKEYKPIDNIINIGVNKAFLNENIKLDFLFMQDWGVKDYIDKLDDLKYSNIVKFFGVAPEHLFDRSDVSLTHSVIPESIILKYKARQYFQHSSYLLSEIKFYKDIETNYIECGGTVALAAIQFALYTNPQKIYLVGCDCSNGHYIEQNGNSKFTHLVKPWVKLKEFAQIYYPDTEIICVNPVGLKNIFLDLYQQH